MTTAIPDVIDAIIALARTAVTIDVFDGYPVTDDTNDKLMVGVDDPRSEDSAISATSRQSWANTTGKSRQEEGEVVCAIDTYEGSGDMKVARDRAFAQVNLLAAALKTNYTLGLSMLLWIEYGATTDYYANQDSNGANATVVFRLAYKARI